MVEASQSMSVVVASCMLSVEGDSYVSGRPGQSLSVSGRSQSPMFISTVNSLSVNACQSVLEGQLPSVHPQLLS